MQTVEGRAQFLSEPLDLEWVSDVHLPKGHPPFGSFEIFGPEDCPSTVHLYASGNPSVFAEPVAKYKRDHNGLLRLVRFGDMKR